MNDQLPQQPSPVNVQVSPAASTPGFDVYAMLLQAHSSAIRNSTDMQNHLKECNDRDRRNETMFNDTKATINTIFNKLDANKRALDESLARVSADVNTSNKWVYMIVGGITLGGVLLEKVNLVSLFHP